MELKEGPWKKLTCSGLQATFPAGIHMKVSRSSELPSPGWRAHIRLVPSPTVSLVPPQLATQATQAMVSFSWTGCEADSRYADDAFSFAQSRSLEVAPGYIVQQAVPLARKLTAELLLPFFRTVAASRRPHLVSRCGVAVRLVLRGKCEWQT